MLTRGVIERDRHAVRELFDEKARGWAKKYAPGGALVWRIGEFRDVLLRQRPPPARVLELGCGTGQLARELAARGYEVEAYDVSERMIQEARTTVGTAKVTLTVLPPRWTALPASPASFDAAVASSVFEYLDDPASVLRELSRVLRPGGALAFSVPDVGHPMRRVERFVAPIVRLAAVARVAARIPRVGPWARYLDVSKNRFSEDEWCVLARQAGFLPSPVEGRRRGPLRMLSFVRDPARGGSMP
jgi:ubiquinone/menaquinone biosynthesis C-methylase UbiE